MKLKFLSACFGVFLCLFSQNSIAQNYDTVQIKTIKLTEKVYMLQGAGGNIGVLLGRDGIVLIDDQFAPLTEKIKNALKILSNKPVRFIINTHYHGDHTGGNENFAGEGAIIVAQDNSRLRMTTDQFNATINMTQKAAPMEALPKVTFTESVTLYLNNETVQVYHVKNAHTDGDAIIYLKESNVFHAGDVFVRYGLPFIDQSSGGSIDGMINGVNNLLSFVNDSSRIIPGHGDLAVRKDLVDYQKMLIAIRSMVLGKIKEGKTLKEIVDANPLKDYKAVFPREYFIKSVYDSLKK